MNELYHYGIKRRSGRYPWGSGDRPYQRDKGLQNLKNAYSNNLEKFGKDREHNVLYITGLSGSGKSTTALSIKKDNDVIIHLDGYSEEENKDVQNSDFNKWLNNNISEWDDVYFKNSSKPQYWNKVDEFAKAIEEYGKEQFDNGNRVIVEGVQIFDNWLYPNSDFLEKMPTIVINTNSKISNKRAIQRDEITESLIDRVKQYEIAQLKIDEFINNTKSYQTGYEYVLDIIHGRR